MTDQATVQPKVAPTKKGGRGVSYPVMGLEEAIEKARVFHREERKSAAPVASAIKHFGYSPTSSGGRQVVATLIAFGLLQDEGRSDDRQVKLTDRGLTILLDEPQSKARQVALAESAAMPKLYATILAKWPDGLPSDHALGFYLQKEFDFNPKTLKAFIKDFRASLAFANAAESPTIERESRDSADDQPSIEVGDLIQWEANGVLRLEAPRRVRAKTELDGVPWLFVDGSETGIPMSEAVFVERGSSEGVPAVKPPTLPLAAVSAIPAAVGEREWLRGPLSKAASYRLIVNGELGPKELGKLITLLQAQKDVLSDDGEEAKQ